MFNENKSFLKYITINVREHRRAINKWTIQRHWQHSSHKAKDEDKQNTKNTAQYRKLRKDEQHGPTIKQV